MRPVAAERDVGVRVPLDPEGVRVLEGLSYIVVQILGGLCGVALANIMFDLPAFDPSTNARSGFPIWLGEVVATAGLIAIIGVLTRTGRGHLGPILVPAWIGAAYFFTSYDEARRILDVAIASSDKSLADLTRETRQERKAKGLKPMTRAEEEEELGINPWREARISTVPLDFAVTLATKSGRQKGGSVYFRVSPSQETVDDALALDSKSGKTELAEGKVPLFYFDDFKIPRADFVASATNGKAALDGTDLPSDEVSPVYFSKAALLDAYNKSNKGNISSSSDIPEIKVSELMSVVTAMVDPDVKDDDLKSLAFVPPAER